MKSLFTLFVLQVSFFANAEIAGWDYNSGARIISDTLDLSLPRGVFALYGTVHQGNREGLAASALVTNMSETIKTHSNFSGYFEVQFSISDTTIYCYNWPHGEVSVNGPFISQHRIHVEFLFERDGIYRPFRKETSNCTKPVIYAYNSPGEVQLSVIPRGGFSFTFPTSETGKWRFTTNDDGYVCEVTTKKNYPYLFWEGPGKNLDFIVQRGNFMENVMLGHLIKTDTCMTFFERVLPLYGLNEKETADFITWWAPQLIQKDYALLQFFTNDDYAEYIAEINVWPVPDALLRIYMYVTPLDKPEVDCKIVEPVIKPFTRTGFTVIEWGGSLLQTSRVLN